MFDQYLNQSRLLLQILPLLKPYDRLALKGGTALNFFVQDFPRLSVDIDLAYTRIDSREESLEYINQAMENSMKKAKSLFPGSKVQVKRTSQGNIRGVIFQTPQAAIKIEPNHIIRGTLFPPETRNLVPAAGKRFMAELEFTVLSIPDLYGGKICAALDRQHPRDLFDVKLMLDTIGFTRPIMQTFLVYLISHPRPIAEVLTPNMQDLTESYEKEFKSMTDLKIDLNTLIETRTRLIHLIHANLEPADKEFLLSVKEGAPQWNLFPFNHVKNLPAVRWKLKNISKMKSKAHKLAKEKLIKVLKLN